VIRGVVLIAMLLGAGVAQAQLYRWVDENGRVRYSDTPPLYTAPDCGKICADAKALLDNRGIPYREVVVRSNDQIEDLKKLAGKSQVPTLQVGSQAVSGFETAAWTGALDRAGYPSSTAGYKPRPNVAGASLPPVKLYTNSECKELCAAARSLLAERKVPFQEVEVLTIGKVVQKGYEPATYHRLLDASGFLKLAEK
jgi:glutaredoxin